MKCDLCKREASTDGSLLCATCADRDKAGSEASSCIPVRRRLVILLRGLLQLGRFRLIDWRPPSTGVCIKRSINGCAILSNSTSTA